MGKKYKGTRVMTLLLVCVMIFSIWSPSIFAIDASSPEEEIDSATGEEDIVEETELLDTADPDEKGEQSQDHEQGDQDLKEEKQEEKPTDQKQGKEKLKAPVKKADSASNEQTLVSEEDAPSYYPASSSLKAGPIITSLAAPLLKSGMRMFASNVETFDFEDPMEGLNLTKQASTVGAADDDGRHIFQLDLTATTDSEEVTSVKPFDLILVLDRSGSMTENMGGYNYTAISSNPATNTAYYVKINGEYQEVAHYSGTRWRYGSLFNRRYVSWDANGDDNSPGGNSNNPVGKPFYERTSVTSTRLDVLKESANTFVTTVSQTSPDSNIAVVSFSSTYEGAQEVTVDYDLSKADTHVTGIKTAINGLVAKGGTHSDAGLKKANEIFNLPANDTERDRVVIMFTDGEPGTYGFHSQYLNNGYSHAAATINQAAVLKGNRDAFISSDVSFEGRTAGSGTTGSVTKETGKGATIYTIGVFSSNISSKVHKYMAWVSSDNKENATSSEGHEYYFTADTAEALDAIFQSISHQIGETIDDVVIKDYIDPRFDIVDIDGNLYSIGDTFTIGNGQEGTIKQDEQGIYVEWKKTKIEPGTLEDGKGFKGSVYVKAKDDFIGGNNVPTNRPGITAIYSGDVNVGSFPIPLANVPFKLNIQNIQDTIFLGEAIPRTKVEAQDDMVTESLNEASYEYPTDMLAFTWNPTYTDGQELAATKTFGLTVNATAKKYIADSTTHYNAAVGNLAIDKEVTGTYTVHVVDGSLLITKIISQGGGMHDPNQTFVFEIKQYEDPSKDVLVRTFYETIRVDETSNTRTIVKLPKGFYEVTEKTDWSWEYEAVGATENSDTLGMNADGSRNVGKVEASTSFTNKAKAKKYLTSIDWVINIFTGGGN